MDMSQRCVIVEMDRTRPTWLIFGWRGWIGGMVRKIIEDRGDVVHLAKSRAETSEDEIRTLKPTHVVAWIGRTHSSDPDGLQTIDYLENRDKLAENLNDNLYATIVLAGLSEKYGFHLTSGGTGCIFSQESREFTENDDPNFFGSAYSVVKGVVDRIMRSNYPNVLNARIRMPISQRESPRNFITKILNYKEIHSVPNSMTVLPELLPVLVELASRNVKGTLNLTNPGKISHNEILEMYREIVDPTKTWSNVDELGSLTLAGRSNNSLSTLRLEELCKEHGIKKIKHIKDAVRSALELQ